MARIRLKTQWHDKGRERSPEEIGGALAFYAWRLADGAVAHMHRERFEVAGYQRYLAVVGEFLAFLVQIADRLAYERVEDDDRHRLITAMALKCADTLTDNLPEAASEPPAAFRQAFIERMNRRLSDYADFTFPEGRPGLPALRYLAACVDEAIGGSDKWAAQQVIEVEAPGAVETLQKVLDQMVTGQPAEPACCGPEA